MPVPGIFTGKLDLRKNKKQEKPEREREAKFMFFWFADRHVKRRSTQLSQWPMGNKKDEHTQKKIVHKGKIVICGS